MSIIILERKRLVAVLVSLPRLVLVLVVVKIFDPRVSAAANPLLIANPIPVLYMQSDYKGNQATCTATCI